MDPSELQSSPQKCTSRPPVKEYTKHTKRPEKKETGKPVVSVYPSDPEEYDDMSEMCDLAF